MSANSMQANSKRSQRGLRAMAVATAACVVAAGVAGCRSGDEGSRVAGWSLTDPSQRHPIMVSQQPSTVSIRVQRGNYGLTPQQRAQVISFVEKYRTVDAGNSKLVIEAPSGAANEVAAMQAVAEIRSLMSDVGFGAASIAVEAYHASGEQTPAIRISYLRFVAEGPQCGRWPTNLAETESNLNYPNLGCAQQRNLAAMVANPADLIGPRTMTPAARERRDVQWDKYIKGDSTVSTKQDDEKAKVKSN
jgi:pilus assembly protein CpaD